jgi:hypothetical protein
MKYSNGLRPLPAMRGNGMRVAPGRWDGQEAKWDQDR